MEPVETWARALAAAALLGDAEAALGRLGGRAGDHARAIVAGWRALDRHARATSIAAAASVVRAPVPAYAERVDRGWIEAALGDDPRGRVAWEGRHTDTIGVWWTRRVTAGWVALPAEDPALPESPADLARWPAERVVAAMRRIGLAVVAHVALDGGDAAIARIAAAIVDGPVVVELARRLRADAGLRDGMGPVRAAAGVVAGIELGTDLGVGAGVLARHLDGDAAVQVMLVVPPAIAQLIRPGLEVGWQAIRSLIGP